MTTRPAKPQNLPWILPYITVKDVDAAATFYEKAFHFKKHNLAPGKDNTTWHAEMTYNGQMIMLGKQGVYGATTQSPASSHIESPITLYAYCENVDEFYAHAIAAGATSTQAPEDTFWGDRMCSLKDPEGYIWCFATNVSDHQ